MRSKEDQTKEIHIDTLKADATRSRRRLIDELSQVIDTHYLVLMQSVNGGAKKLMKVGPGSQYKTIQSALAQIPNDSTAIAYCDCRHITPPKFKRNRFGFKTKSPFVQSNDSINSEKRSVESTRQDQDLSLEHKSSLKTQLEEREIDLIQMEEALIDRMNQHMEKTAELEQWEENLFHRERVLQEREAELNEKLALRSEA